MTTITTSLALPEDVARYCEKQDLSGHLESALRLGEEFFHPIERLEVEIQLDPEVENEETVIIDIWVKMSVETALHRDKLFTQRWATSVPPAALKAIVLLYQPI
jgi:hypothetical protein